MGFQISKILFFTWLCKRAKCDPNRIKIAFSKNLQKIAQHLGALPPDSHSLRQLVDPGPVCYTFELH